LRNEKLNQKWYACVMMDIGETLTINDRQGFRAWLEQHHQTSQEIWLVFYKKSSGKQRVPLEQAVEEALCFGWIDGLLKPLDAERYALRFSRRRKRSHWAALNRERVLKLLQEGKMTPVGQATLPADILEEWQASPEVVD
jgi:uncharacterized protein YdeI (YjbR/CyaY-like superfamily)